ncbi:uncharacterized protein LOC126857742 [Cataglyphis hispanica]|uniref:uncharacterized protein LOC126857742 n=1 Tax=Cataglyphis hispanica TaxID=1086592 RepID=UPI0021805120|nr:uncharacterized protein LOC126857742 [Cataglyphis hispanica]
MRLHKISKRHLFPLHLLLAVLVCAWSAEVSEVICEKVSFKETSLGDRHSGQERTTSASVTNNSQKLTSPIVFETLLQNDTNIFRPSIHLGEIEQPKSRKNPFNNVQHVRFENSVHLDTQNALQNAYQGVSSLMDEATRSSKIKLQDDIQIPSSIRHPFNDQREVTEIVSRSPLEEVTVGHVSLDQAFFQNILKKPEDTSTIFGKSMTDHRSTGTYLDLSRSPPYVINYYASQNQNAHQPLQETTLEMIKKPESNGVLVVRQSTYTRKRKFPYTFYQPGDEYHDIQYVEAPHTTMAYPQMRSMSPWKKIIHLIGTFLPLGLLLALTPKVVRVDNNTTTQPSIVLSKLRVADLPIEHKQAGRSLDEQTTTVCEDRSICELILAGGESQSNTLQNILWNLATRTADDVAKRNGLREIFSAVREKDCTSIDC